MSRAEGSGRRFDREIAALALPALGTLAADPLVSLVDTAFVGRIGAPELGALGVAAEVFAIGFFLFGFLAFTTTSLVARAVGAGDRAEAGRTTVTALALAGVLGVAALLALELAVEPILRVMGAADDVLAPGRTYLRIRALATPAVLVVLAGHGAFRGYQDTRTPLAISLVLNMVNLGLDPILIFGLGWGIAGAAWATVIGQWVGAVGFLVMLLRWRRDRLGIVLAPPRLSLMRRFLGIGRDLVLRTILLLTSFTMATAVAARIGTVAVAAHQVATQVWMFLALSVDALAVSAQAIVGRELGRDDPAAARAVANRTLGWGLAVGLALAAVVGGLAAVLPGAFSDDARVIAAVESVYAFLVFTQPLNAVVFVWDGIVMGAGDFRYLARAMALSAAAAAVVLLAVIPLGWGLAGVWWGLLMLMLARGATLAWWQWGRSRPGDRPHSGGRAPAEAA